MKVSRVILLQVLFPSHQSSWDTVFCISIHYMILEGCIDLTLCFQRGPTFIQHQLHLQAISHQKNKCSRKQTIMRDLLNSTVYFFISEDYKNQFFQEWMVSSFLNNFYFSLGQLSFQAYISVCQIILNTKIPMVKLTIALPSYLWLQYCIP